MYVSLLMLSTYHSNLDYPRRIIEVTKTNFHFIASIDFIIFFIKHSICSRKKSSKYLFIFTSRQRTFKKTIILIALCVKDFCFGSITIPSITWNVKLAFQDHTNCLLLYYPIFLIMPTAISCSHTIMRSQSTTSSPSFKLCLF